MSDNTNPKQKPIALEERAETGDARLFSPSAGRNKQVVSEALRTLLPETGLMLEVGSGTGEHVVTFAAAMPGLHWQPSDPDARSRASIAAWIAHEGLANVAPPLDLDATAQHWGAAETAGPYAAMVSLNMIHIAPWAAAQGLFAGAGRLLAPGGVLALYGPFMEDGVHTAPSNAEFDASLKSRDPRWGVRDINDLEALAQAQGLTPSARIAMPANNQVVTFTKL